MDKIDDLFAIQENVDPTWQMGLHKAMVGANFAGEDVLEYNTVGAIEENHLDASIPKLPKSPTARSKMTERTFQ